MTFHPEPGEILAASESLSGAPKESFSRAEVAFLIALAYKTGRVQSLAEDQAERSLERLPEKLDPDEVRQRRRRERLADYERRSGPARYNGGPVSWGAQ